MMGELQCEPENFLDTIIFMPMFNDIVWDPKANDEICGNNSKTTKQYARRFLCGHWSFLETGTEKKWYGTHDLNFAGINHPVFRDTSVVERGKLRSKESGKKSIHFNDSTQNI